MGIVAFVLFAALLGCLAWAVTTYIPMAAAVKTVIIVAVVIVIAVVLLKALGVPIEDVQIPRIFG